jgi:hypothetical protein
VSTLKANSWKSTDGVNYEKLIQHVSYNTTGEVINVSNPNGQYTSTTLSVSITAKRANSKFFVLADCQGYVSANSSNGWNIALVRTVGGVQTFVAGTQGSDSWMGMYHSSGLAANSYAKARTVLDTPNVAKGTTLTYNVWVGGWTSTGTIYLGYNGYGNYDQRITVFEFAS